MTQLASGENFLKYVLHHHLGGCESTFIFGGSGSSFFSQSGLNFKTYVKNYLIKGFAVFEETNKKVTYHGAGPNVL